jgi:CheY-like chemotaxis protein
MDLSMPEMDGWTAIRLIKGDERTSFHSIDRAYRTCPAQVTVNVRSMQVVTNTSPNPWICLTCVKLCMVDQKDKRSIG